ncbi:MAG: hypothetical protein INR65_11435 [Gluconacetobacter diazotrophicus]|nr:hypothetical protein [Gluconacetobacter diazotrophicus]
MVTWIDARIPVRLLPDGRHPPVAEPDAALVAVGAMGAAAAAAATAGWTAVRCLPESGLAPAGHPNGCGCCGGRNGFAELLGAMFRDRSTGILPFFRAIAVRLPPHLVGPAAETLGSDPVLSSRYRLDTGMGEN